MPPQALRRLLFAAALLLLLAPRAWCGLRVAIVAHDDDSQPAAEAVASGLAATHKEVELAGKDEVAAALKAHLLPADATTAQVLDFAKALNAQGVLILGTQGDTAKPATRARLFSRQGVTLFDSTVASAPGQAAWLPGLIEGRVAKFLPQLGNDPGFLEPVVIGEINTAAGLPPGLATFAGALVRSRFEAEPGVLVRETLGLDLISPQNPPSDDASKTYWSKPWTVDGSIDAGATPATIALHLRLHNPDGAAVKTFTAEGAPAALKDLVAQAAHDALKDLSQPATAAWDPDAGARELVDATSWAKNLAQYQSATVMAEQACALSRDTLNEAVFLRAWLYLQHARSWRAGPMGGQEKDLPLPERYAAVMKAVDACQVYLDGNFINTNPEMEMKYRGQMRYDVIRTNVTNTASEILSELVDAQKADGPASEPLRQALRKLLPFDPRAGKLPGERWEVAYFATYWADNEDELIDYYCASLLSDEDWQKTVATDSVWRFTKFQAGIFNSVGPNGYGIAQEGQVSSMDSSPSGAPRYADAAAAFARLTDKLAANPRTRVVAYLIQSNGGDSLDAKKTAFGKFLDEFWDRREQLMKEGRYADWLDNIMYLDPEVQSEYPDRQLKLLRYFLVNGGKCWDYFFKSLWKPALFPPDQAGDIWKEFNAFRLRLGGNTKWLDPYADTFLAQFPAYKTAVVAAPQQQEAAPAAVDADPLVVTGWHQYGGPAAANERYMVLGSTLAEGKLWLWGKYNGDAEATLLGIDLGTFETKAIGIDPPGAPAEHSNFPYQVLVTPEAFYVVNEGPSPVKDAPHTAVLSSYDRKDGKWESRSIPWVQPGAASFVDGKFYLNLVTVVNKVWIGGLSRYDWEAGKVTALADSRRKPALNQFDNRNEYNVTAVFQGPGRKICAMIEGVPYYVRDDPGQWEGIEVQPGMKWHDLAASALDGEVLLQSQAGDWAYFFEPGTDKFETWIAPGGGIWDMPPEVDKNRHGTQGGHYGLAPGGMIWLRPLPDSPRHFELRWFKRGGSRTGERTTLLLKSDLAPEAKTFGGFSTEPKGPAPFAAMDTEKGILIWNDGYGFWFVPYTDIEAHIKKSK